MSKKSLLETNPYLRDLTTREQIISVVTVSSSAIEGVHASATQAMKNIAKGKTALSAARGCVSSGKARK